ncbi:cell death-inducing p53-target protein 1 [Osmerus eperlanus]|uniref:cell death-inducing p53-target protein 1 n=1 Tax=Osmerus eperlanus TaxID=29151 RepID=UPI002E0FBFE0
MSSDPPPPYSGGPSAPLVEEKNGQPVGQPAASAEAPITVGPPQGQPLPPDYGPPPYEASLQPGFLPPHVPGDGPMPMPILSPHGGFHAPPGHFVHPPPGHFGPGPVQFGPGPVQFGPVPGQFGPGPGQFGPGFGPGPGHFYEGHATTVLSPQAAGARVTVLHGEIFQSLPVQTVCSHCHQAIVTRISYDVGLMNTLFCLFCFCVGCDLGCCLIPCLIDDLKDVTHTCPNCKGHIYTYKRIC